MSQIESDGASSDREGSVYKPPRISVLGTVAELTQAFPGGAGDGFPATTLLVPSDRGLKDHLAPVNAVAAAGKLARL